MDGAGLREHDAGIVITDVESNAEIGEFGVQDGDTLLQWGDLDLSQVSLEDLVAQLRPTSSGMIENDLGDIVVRTVRGDVYMLDPTAFFDPRYHAFE